MEEEELTGEAGPSQGLEGHLETSQEGDPCKTKKHQRIKSQQQRVELVHLDVSDRWQSVVHTLLVSG